jgi:hypothetical protein
LGRGKVLDECALCDGEESKGAPWAGFGDGEAGVLQDRRVGGAEASEGRRREVAACGTDEVCVGFAWDFVIVAVLTGDPWTCGYDLLYVSM